MARATAPGGGNRASPDKVCTTLSLPATQHGQRNTSIFATRSMKSAADSTAPGLGIGSANACRASARRALSVLQPALVRVSFQTRPAPLVSDTNRLLALGIKTRVAQGLILIAYQPNVIHRHIVASRGTGRGQQSVCAVCLAQRLIDDLQGNAASVAPTALRRWLVIECKRLSVLLIVYH